MQKFWAGKDYTDEISHAYHFFVIVRMSRQGDQKTFATTTKNRVRRDRNEQVSAFRSAVEGLEAVHNRLVDRVMIRCTPALQLLLEFDQPDVVAYCDPPYLPSTRYAPAYYRHEMDEADHVQLLGLLVKLKSKVLLSGYPSELYDKTLVGWNRVMLTEQPAHMAAGPNKPKRQEIIWKNF